MGSKRNPTVQARLVNGSDIQLGTTGALLSVSLERAARNRQLIAKLAIDLQLDSDALPVLWPFLQQGLPSLDELVVTIELKQRPWRAPELTLASFPKLTKLRLEGVRPRVAPSVLANLRVLALDNVRIDLPQALRFEDVLDCVLGLKSVEDITICNYLGVVDGIAPRPRRRLHSLPNLKNLRLEEHPSAIRSLLSHLSVPVEADIRLLANFQCERQGNHPPSEAFTAFLPEGSEGLPVLRQVTVVNVICARDEDIVEIIGGLGDLDVPGRISLGIDKKAFSTGTQGPSIEALLFKDMVQSLRKIFPDTSNVASLYLHGPLDTIARTTWTPILYRFPGVQRMILRGGSPGLSIMEALMTSSPTDGTPLCPRLEEFDLQGSARDATALNAVAKCFEWRVDNGARHPLSKLSMRLFAIGSAWSLSFLTYFRKEYARYADTVDVDVDYTFCSTMP
ncbi:hypothetical protein C8Q73DRAFT_222218 [Cubamyces lactineus]|nr:hypothetical protein C8Q73DRAFT_222218 [Cubamyces lactineus]